MTPDLGEGLVLLCDWSGTIDKIIYHNVGLSAPLTAPRKWHALLDEESHDKGDNFIDLVKREGAAFNWELNLKVGKKIVPFHFTGIAFEGNLLVMAANTNTGLNRLIKEFSRLGDEQTNAIRMTVQENVKLKQRVDPDSAYFDEISSLNNELVNLQRELQKKNIELEQLNEEKNHLLGIAAHDLRNPLSNILYLVEFLREESSAYSESQHTFLSHIESLSKFMLKMVEDLLDVSAIQAGRIDLNLEQADLVELVRNLYSLHKGPALNKGISLFFEPGKDGIYMDVDRAKIEQVVNNLITNSIKYSLPSTQVHIRIEEHEREVSLSVSDQGIGIAEDELRLLFKPFTRASGKTTSGERSTGLGLFIVKRIIEAHGGHIEVQSTPGTGSTFTVLLVRPV